MGESANCFIVDSILYYFQRVGDRILPSSFRVLKNCGQITLAYLTAVNHGLDEEASDLFESLPVDPATGEKLVPKADPEKAKLFAPSPPILHTSDSNWPLLTVSKGFFDGVASARAAGGASAGGPGKFTSQPWNYF